MHSYLPFLIEDITQAFCPESCAGQLDKTLLDMEEELLNADQMLDTELAEFPFSYYCGLEKSQFPPPTQLCDGDIATIIRAFECLLVSWHIELDYCDSISNRCYYRSLLSILDRPFLFDINAFVLYDFCEEEIRRFQSEEVVATIVPVSNSLNGFLGI